MVNVEERVERFKELIKQGFSVRKALKESKLQPRDYKKYYDEIWSDPDMQPFKPKRAVEKAAETPPEVVEADRRLRQYGVYTEPQSNFEREVEGFEMKRKSLLRAAEKVQEMFGGPPTPSVEPGPTQPPTEEEKPEEKGKEARGYPMLIPIKEIRHPDGRIEIQYSLGPEHYRAVRQTDMAVDKLVPELIGEVKATRSDISNVGNRIFTLLENYWGPQLKKVQPWTYFPIPITMRSPSQREKELAAYERNLSTMETPPQPKETETPQPKPETEKEKPIKFKIAGEGEEE